MHHVAVVPFRHGQQLAQRVKQMPSALLSSNSCVCLGNCNKPFLELCMCVMQRENASGLLKEVRGYNAAEPTTQLIRGKQKKAQRPV